MRKYHINILQIGECGVPGPNMLITGGEEATPHEYPWMAALFFEQGSGNTYFCGGTLVMFMVIQFLKASV